MTFEFTAEAISWRGPPPYVFVPVPEAQAAEIKAVSRLVTYGWGVVPARVTVGATEVPTSLFPKNGGYLVPIKVAVQRAEGVEVGDLVTLRVEIGVE